MSGTPLATLCRLQVSLLTWSLLESSKNKNIDWSLRRSFPWVLWHLWKVRNTLLFEKTQTPKSDIMNRAREDADLWFQVNYPEAPLSIPTILPGPVHYLVWKKPRAADLKCNVASSWINWQSQSGASSILRNDRGETLLHSRRAYANPVSEIHAALLSLLWAVESMMHLRQRRVIFEFSLAGLRDALSLPESYPQFLCLFEDLQSMLNRMDSWCLCLVSPTENRASESIARSVTRDNRSQSYVAQNGPVWLTTILQADAMGTL
ncbi:hypothetical protein DY000_02003001 [Brassica cretica]|uniref:RNase H type-1 domain-containing protein n=1 Tax=Brassica cretica TaxID=69181 RepID=A0ABQ7CKL3_BRACR|nr:hypothetical protein DY000_02003001 [Brassica cretica]